MRRLDMLMVILVLLLLPAIAKAGPDSFRITKEELKAKMDRGEGILILDVRVSADYIESKVKIKGAVRIDPDSIERKYQILPKDKEIITYCT